jgi:O-acetylserine/cysteine efflux transporter
MSLIVPFTLLVPIVGILSSVVVFDEPFQSWKCAACLLVLGGLCINILSTRYLNLKAAVKSA